jgi:hypothetical protein
VATTIQFGDEPTFLEPRNARRIRVMLGCCFVTLWCIVFTDIVCMGISPHTGIVYLMQSFSLDWVYVCSVGFSCLFLAGKAIIAIILVRKGSSPPVSPSSCTRFARAWCDMIRSAPIASSEVIGGDSLIMAARLYLDRYCLETSTSDFPTRSA